MICIETVGEIMAIARQNAWPASKRETMEKLLRKLVVIDISDSALISEYAEIDYLLRNHKAGAIKMGKNDLWIAAATAATSAVLLTCDRDFDPLHNVTFRVYYEHPN